MTIDDLKTGMIVTLRNGYKTTVLRDIVKFINSFYSDSGVLVLIGVYGWINLRNYDGTRHIRNHNYDIVKIEIPYAPICCIDHDHLTNMSNIVWEEE